MINKLYIFLFLAAFNCITTLAIYGQEKTTANHVKVTYEYKSSLSGNRFDTHLFVNDLESQFVYVRKHRVIEGERYRSTTPFFKYINNYNFAKNQIEENRILSDSTKLYAQWDNQLVWELHPDEKVINGYKVRKATTDSFEVDKDDPYYYGKAIAWYAVDINIPSGPARYYGLPGLILELGYEFNPEVYTLKSIDVLSESKNIQLDKTHKVAPEDVIYYSHKNKEKVNEIVKSNKKSKKKK